MYRRKKEPKALYSIHNPHSQMLRDWSGLETIRAVSIDPGKSNFCIRVEDRPLHPESKLGITPLLYDNVSFTRSAPKETKPKEEESDDPEELTYSDISRYLLSHYDLLSTVNLVVIERQLPDNYFIVRISQHILTWFMEHLRDKPTYPLIFEVSGKIKNTAWRLTSLNKTAAKKWSSENVPLLLLSRGDQYSYDIIKRSRKKDDLGDVILQLEAICELMGWYCHKGS